MNKLGHRLVCTLTARAIWNELDKVLIQETFVTFQKNAILLLFIMKWDKNEYTLYFIDTLDKMLKCLFYQSVASICKQAPVKQTNFVFFFSLHFRYIEIFRSTEQQMMRSLMQNSPRNNFGGRNSNNGNSSSNGNNRMHPYERNGNNNFGRGNNMRGRNQNMRNDFRRGKQCICLKDCSERNSWKLLTIHRSSKSRWLLYVKWF